MAFVKLILIVSSVAFLISCRTFQLDVVQPSDYSQLTYAQKGRYLFLLERVNKINISNAQRYKYNIRIHK